MACNQLSFPTFDKMDQYVFQKALIKIVNPVYRSIKQLCSFISQKTLALTAQLYPSLFMYDVESISVLKSFTWKSIVIVKNSVVAYNFLFITFFSYCLTFERFDSHDLFLGNSWTSLQELSNDTSFVKIADSHFRMFPC